jgi:murein L,D-transpeptidase YcbB/YkuD
MSSVGGSRAPWWLGWLFFGVLVFAPGFVITVVDKAADSLSTYGEELPDATATESTGEAYTPPCDTQAVLDALGMNVVQYQASRGLTVDGLVGPQTGAALCAEDLSEGGA